MQEWGQSWWVWHWDSSLSRGWVVSPSPTQEVSLHIGLCMQVLPSCFSQYDLFFVIILKPATVVFCLICTALVRWLGLNSCSNWHLCREVVIRANYSVDVLNIHIWLFNLLVFTFGYDGNSEYSLVIFHTVILMVYEITHILNSTFNVYSLLILISNRESRMIHYFLQTFLTLHVHSFWWI